MLKKLQLIFFMDILQPSPCVLLTTVYQPDFASVRQLDLTFPWLPLGLD